jgi:hypothetical protein
MAGKVRFAASTARAVGAAAVLLGQAACYTLQPMSAAQAPILGDPVAFDVTDAGRVALGGSMGPAVLQIEGRVTKVTDAGYELAVTQVHLIGGGEQTWSGEKVQVNKEYVARSYAKEFSRGRTILLSAIGVGVFVAIITQSLTAHGLGAGDTKTPPDTSHSVRRPAHVPGRP